MKGEEDRLVGAGLQPAPLAGGPLAGAGLLILRSMSAVIETTADIEK